MSVVSMLPPDKFVVCVQGMYLDGKFNYSENPFTARLYDAIRQSLIPHMVSTNIINHNIMMSVSRNCVFNEK